MARAKKVKPLTAPELRERLRARYEPPEWVLLEEVQPTVWFMNKPRRTDMVGLSTWDSRGLRMVGFELKSSRADVLKELKEPEKAQAMQLYCDLWYLVVGRTDLVGKDELPPNWGLIVPHGKGLKIAKHASELEPAAWPRGLIFMLIRKAHGNTIKDEEKRKIRKEAYEEAKGSISYQLEQFKKLESLCQAFAQASGIDIRSWSNEERIKEKGEFLKTVMCHGLERYRIQLRSLARDAERLGQQLRNALGDEDGD